MSSTKNRYFVTEISRGFTLKETIGGMAAVMKRTTFEVNENGIFHRGSDEPLHILIDLNFSRKNLPSFECKEAFFFSVNLSHFYKILKNVKKKDSITMYIESKKQGRLFLDIRSPETKNSIDKKKELVHVTINILKEQPDQTELPEIVKCDDGELVKVYSYPKLIKSSELQKMKKMTSVGKIITVIMQGCKYISFESDQGELYGTSQRYGDYDENEKTYKAQFNVSNFSLLTKLPGVCSNMQFYSPNIEGYPLKICMDAYELGDIVIYIKDVEQISREQIDSDKGGKSFS